MVVRAEDVERDTAYQVDFRIKTDVLVLEAAAAFVRYRAVERQLESLIRRANRNAEFEVQGQCEPCIRLCQSTGFPSK